MPGAPVGSSPQVLRCASHHSTTTSECSLKHTPTPASAHSRPHGNSHQHPRPHSFNTEYNAVTGHWESAVGLNPWWIQNAWRRPEAAAAPLPDRGGGGVRHKG